MISKITTQKITDVLVNEIGFDNAQKLVSQLVTIPGNASFRLSMEAVSTELTARQNTPTETEKMMATLLVAAELPKVKAGDAVHCPHCNGQHEVIESDSRGNASTLFYKCPVTEYTYLAAIDGYLIAAK